jgi:DNA invertase Pin-like site-specific DNA recombinase
VLLVMLGAFAEFGTDLRRERQPEGIAKAKPAARLIAGINGPHGGAAFAEGHELDPERAAEVPAKWIGRMLMLPQAQQLPEPLER